MEFYLVALTKTEGNSGIAVLDSLWVDVHDDQGCRSRLHTAWLTVVDLGSLPSDSLALGANQTHISRTCTFVLQGLSWHAHTSTVRKITYSPFFLPGSVSVYEYT